MWGFPYKGTLSSDVMYETANNRSFHEIEKFLLTRNQLYIDLKK